MNNDYICDDREKPIPKEILNMSDEEIEVEFRKRFDKVIKQEQAMVILPPELKEKEKIVLQYRIGINKYKEDTPDYVLEYAKEIEKYIDESVE